MKSVDFDAFLSILYPPYVCLSQQQACIDFFYLSLRNFNRLQERSFEEWSSILDLSTRWGFTSICELALRRVEPPNPLQRLILARKYNIEEWMNPALLELCERQEPLSLEEARLMDFEDVVFVGTVRQTVRSSDLIVDGVGIRERIQARRSEKLSSPVSELQDSCALGPQSPPLDLAPSPPPAAPSTIVSLFEGNTVSEEDTEWSAQAARPKKSMKKSKKKPRPRPLTETM